MKLCRDMLTLRSISVNSDKLELRLFLPNLLAILVVFLMFSRIILQSLSHGQHLPFHREEQQRIDTVVLCNVNLPGHSVFHNGDLLQLFLSRLFLSKAVDFVFSWDLVALLVFGVGFVDFTNQR